MFSVLSTLVKQPVISEAPHIDAVEPKDLHEIQQMVDRALHDLSSQLGKAGALEGILRIMGIQHLDTVHDDSGSTVLERLHEETEAYVAKINKLMTEIQIMAASNEGQ